MLFLRIISWKGASRFNGGVCFSDGRLHFQMGGMSHGEGFGFGGRGGFSKKNHKMGGAPHVPPTMGNPGGGVPHGEGIGFDGGSFQKKS